MNPRWTRYRWLSRVLANCSHTFRFLPRPRLQSTRRPRFARTDLGLPAETLEDRLLLATILVDDDGGGDQTSIQAAIDAAVAGDVILINGGDDGIHTEAGISINKDLTIQGTTGPAQVIVQAALEAGLATDRVFSVEAETIATIDNLTIRHGRPFVPETSVGLSGGGILNNGALTLTNSTITENSSSSDGGGIFNSGGALAIHNTIISNNTAADNGGGLANLRFTSFAVIPEGDPATLNLTAEELSPGTVHISESTITANTAAGFGGGISNDGGTLEVEDSTISQNTAGFDGGGISNFFGTTAITRSTISANFASGSGGGIENGFGTTTITNSTISGNSANGDGGGILNIDTLAITNSTIVLNQADADGNESGNGGGIFTFNAEISPFTQLFNTIVAGNTLRISDTPSDLGGEDVEPDSAFNLIGDPNSAGGLVHGSNGNIVGQDDGLEGRELLDLSTVLDLSLADNGGPTLTHALVSGSVAIDAGSNSLAVDRGMDGVPLETDQRGFPRIVDIPDVPNADGGVDIGAVEFDLAFFEIAALDANKLEGNAGTTTFTFLVTRSGNTNGPAALDFSVMVGQADGNDFAGGVLPSGTVQFADGETEQTIVINVQGDLLVERDEMFLVQLSNPSTGIIETATAEGTIINDDTALISINDVSANEGDGTLTFTITLSNPVAEDVTVEVHTVDVTATSAGPGQDYVPIPLSQPFIVTFTAGGPLTRTVNVTINDDSMVEPNETFEVRLSNPLLNGEPDSARLVISDDTGVGTIIDDDVATLSISDASAHERDGELTFTITLSHPVAEDVTVSLRTVDVTATSLFGAGQDYIPLPPEFMVTFPAGARTVEFTIRINDDIVLERNETFEVRIFDVRIGEGPVPPGVDGEDDSTRIILTDGTGIGTILNDENIQVFGAGSGSGLDSMPPQVIVKQAETGQVLHNFLAYDSAFRGGVRVASADVNGDGVADVITAAGPGGGPHIKVFDGLSGQIFANFFAYDPGFVGGVFVAAGDVNGDGFADIITGAGAGGGPHVKVFNGQNLQLLHNFFAYAPGFTGGVAVAAGDVNADRFADIITGAGAGGGPHVRVFGGFSLGILADLFAYDPNFAGGVTVASGDINDDGFADIITGAGRGGGPHVRVFNGQNPTQLLSQFFAFDANMTAGLFVGATNVNGDGLAEILVGTGPGRPSEVRLFNGSGGLVGSGTVVFNAHFRSGAHVAGSTAPLPISGPIIPFARGDATLNLTQSNSIEMENDLLGVLFDESILDALLELNVDDSQA